jgi:hypothetical protein
MLWSKPTILYDTVLDYRIEDYVSFVKYFQMKNDPTMSTMRFEHKICLVAVPSTITKLSILWQHLFLDPLLKDMHTGWHLCLLPRHMVVVIKDGLYVCERFVPQKAEKIASTKTYMYRFGYESEMPVSIHDWQQASETVSVPPQYKGFVLQPYQPWYRRAQDIGLTFFRLFAPYITRALCATLICLVLGGLFYGYQNYACNWNRIRVLQAWPAIQRSKAQVGQLLELVGLLYEAKAPTHLVKSIAINDKGLSIQCDEKFTSDHNVEEMKQFLKKYYPYDVRTTIATSSILLEKPHSLSYQAKTRHRC